VFLEDFINIGRIIRGCVDFEGAVIAGRRAVVLAVSASLEINQELASD
jgi:hypothetical protein